MTQANAAQKAFQHTNRANPIEVEAERMVELIAGIDEVGRGCLAGPVYAAAVILPAQPTLRGLRDSKALTAAARERLTPRIERRALAFSIGIATPAEIDQINILQATFLAMRRALAALSVTPHRCLVDGNQNPRLGLPTELVIGGDALHDCIMAASIIAKVARDAEMRRLCTEYPHYGFSQHKGYGTKAHVRALQKHGPCAIHRRSFAPCVISSLQLTAMLADADAALEPDAGARGVDPQFMHDMRTEADATMAFVATDGELRR